MIDRVKLNSVNSIPNNKPQAQPKFTGGFVDGLVTAIQSCEKQPMVNVSLVDAATCIGPRTIIEGKTNGFAGLEAFRRESSGLVINCLLPGVIVAGIAYVAQKPILGAEFQKVNLSKSLANEDTINKIIESYKETPESSVQDRMAKTFKYMFDKLEGADGEIGKDGFKQFKKYITVDDCHGLANIACDGNAKKDAFKDALGELIKKTGINENIRFIGEKDFFSLGFSDLATETSKFVKELIHVKPDRIGVFAEKAINLVNIKSALGLGAIIPLAIFAQPMNRWITAKTSGKKGAPIYKDFKDTKQSELSQKEKKGLFIQKLISVAAMVGVALLSMGGKTSLKKFQFKGLFPTMDQARLISTVTFASRMMASEDKNELREATVRDIATFSSLYFLGDYVAKALATGIQKAKNISLINHLKPLKPNANMLERLAHWAKNTSLKSSAELKTINGGERYRAYCQLANIGFSLISLGVLIPKYTRGRTDKKREEEMKEQGVEKKDIEKYYPHFLMHDIENTQKTAFKSFQAAR